MVRGSESLMAWILRSSLHPKYQPEIELLDGWRQRWGELSKQVKESLAHLHRSDPYYPRDVMLISGFRYPPIDQPVRARIRCAAGPLPDIFGVMIGAAITRRVVDAIEAVESGVHNYLPLELLARGGRPPPEPRVLLNVCRREDTIAVGKSPKLHEVWPDRNKYPGFSFYVGNHDKFNGIASHRDKVECLSIWWEYKLSETMISDRLADVLFRTGALHLREDDPNYLIRVREI